VGKESSLKISFGRTIPLGESEKKRRQNHAGKGARKGAAKAGGGGIYCEKSRREASAMKGAKKLKSEKVEERYHKRAAPGDGGAGLNARS